MYRTLQFFVGLHIKFQASLYEGHLESKERLAIKKNTTSSVNDCTVEDVELLTSPTEC